MYWPSLGTLSILKSWFFYNKHSPTPRRSIGVFFQDGVIWSNKNFVHTLSEKLQQNLSDVNDKRHMRTKVIRPTGISCGFGIVNEWLFAYGTQIVIR